LGGLIPDDVIERIRSATDIVDLVGEYVQLKRAGANHQGLCPFHQEKTPSFSVNPAKQIYHCFGCGVGGDAVGFLMRYDNLTYPEALRKLADRAGIEIPETRRDNRPKPDYGPLYDANEKAAGFFRDCLADKKLGKKARKYLKSRGIDEALAKEFGLGYAPDGWENLAARLGEEGVDEKTLLACGLVAERQKSEGVYDRFRDRLMFTIRDTKGRAVGFGGRIMGEGEPKYLNSPETPVFRKGELLYLLDRAADSIRKNGHAIVVEGYTDAIACHRAGVTNAVATLGTALTEGHLRVLGRYARKVKLVFDADEAGQKAAERSLDVFLGTKLKAKVALLPEGDDPDSMVAGGRTGELAERLRESVGLMEYVVGRLAKRAVSVEGKVEAAARMTDILARIENAVERTHYIKEAAESLGTEEAALTEELDKKIAAEKRRAGYRKSRPETYSGSYKRPVDSPDEYEQGGGGGSNDGFYEYYGGDSGGSPGTASRKSGKSDNRKLPGTAAERELIHLMMLYPEIAHALKEELPSGEFREPELGAVAARVYEIQGPDGTFDLPELVDGLADGPGKLFVLALAAKGGDYEDPDSSARSSMLRLRKETVDARLEELKWLVDEAAKSGDDDLVMKYNREIIALHREKANSEE